MANDNLKKAKKAKNDEFYTQWADIEKEIMAYIDYNSNVFRDKTILLPCDDPEWSNFTKFFAQNFEAFGLKKLISTSYAYESKNVNMPYQISLFEKQAPHFNPDINKVRGKIFTLENDCRHPDAPERRGRAHPSGGAGPRPPEHHSDLHPRGQR